MKTKLIIVFFFLSLTTIKAQNTSIANGSRLSAMGNTGTAIADVWATRNNQATLCLLEYPEIAIFYKNSFALSELSLSALSAALPTKIGVFATSISHFGFAEYNSNQFSIAYAKQLWDIFSLSAQINYHTTKFTAGYQNSSAVSGEVGVLLKLSREFYVGAHVFNPTQSSLSIETNEKLPVRYKIGAAYKPTSSIILCSDANYDSDEKMSFCFGVEFFVIPTLCLRAGATNKPTYFTMGAGYSYKNITFDISYAYHNVLGNISSASISYKFKRE